MKFVMILLCSFSALAEYPYKEVEAGYSDKPGSIVEVSPSTPIKSQDGLGLCYGFSATSLLEHHRCKEKGSSCQSPSDFLSTLDVSSYYGHKRLTIGGDTNKIFMNIEGSKLRIAKEECIQFSTLIHQLSYETGTKNEENGGWLFLVERWNEYRGLGKFNKRNDCVSCLADSIKSTLVNVQTPKDQIRDAFQSANNLEEFLYKTIMPAQCLLESRMAEIPPFKAKTFPTYKDTLSIESLSKKVESILLSGLPLEMGICGMILGNGKCHETSGHSIALFGVKEVCNRNGQCHTMVKVKNSYGQSWQNQNSEGWLELKTLAESSMVLGKHNNINWIEKPGFVLTNKALSKKETIIAPVNNPGSGPTGVPNEYKNHKGVWKCPGNQFRDQYESGCVPMGR